MPTLNLLQYASVRVDGRIYEVGSLTKPHGIDVTGLVHEQIHTVGTETTVKIFDIDDDISDFDFLFIESDQDLILELVTDDDGDVGEEVFTVGLDGSGTAGKYGGAFVLCRDTSYANYTVNFGGGTLDNIETIRVRNLNDTTTAKVHIVAVS